MPARARNWAALAFCFVLLAAFIAAAAPGVTADAIVFGQSACFTGQNKHLGLHYRAGIRAAFKEQNNRGGVKGRRLEIISEDDGYEPEQAAANAKRFVSGNDVFAVIGGVGTPTAKRLAPILRAAGIPFVGPFTGADFLRAAKQFPNVVNLRAGYREETRLIVDYMINKLGKRRFGIIYQDDAFGYSVLANYDMILDSYGLPILAKASYSRNSLAVHSSLFTFSKADLDAIMLVGASPSNSEIINLAHSLGRDYVMANLSFTESYDLRKRVDGSGKGILVSNVMIDPNSSEMRISKRFRSAIQSEHADLMVSAERLINETGPGRLYPGSVSHRRAGAHGRRFDARASWRRRCHRSLCGSTIGSFSSNPTRIRAPATSD